MRTIGVEEELLLVDRTTGVPVPVAGRMLAQSTGHTGDGGTLLHELHREMLEVTTTPHHDLRALGDQIVANRGFAEGLAKTFRAHAVALAVSPTPAVPHPSDGERYRRMIERYGSMPRRIMSCGLHVHVRIDGDEEGVAVLDRIRTWTPIFIALSANSPIHDGVDTGHASWRSVTWNQWPSSGPMELYGSAARYRAHAEELMRMDVLLDPGMLYFDARLARAHPTVEVRVADVPLDPGTTVAIAGLVRALVDVAVEDWRAGRPAPAVSACAVRVANWCAALHGLEGDLIDPLTQRPAPAREVVGTLLAKTMPALVANGDDQLVEHGLAEVFRRGTGAARQRAVFAETGDAGRVALAAAGGDRA